jgi:hypothetical protein
MTEETIQKQYTLFMYSIQEKLLKLCPVIKDLLIEEGILKGAQPRPMSNESQDNHVQNEMLARVIQLQQFIQGGHGSNSRPFQPNNASQMSDIKS